MLASSQSAKERRKTDFPRFLGLLKPIVDYSRRGQPEYNHAKYLESFTENLEKKIPLTELAERTGVKTTKAPRMYDRNLLPTLFKVEKSEKQSIGRPKVVMSLDEPLKQILHQQTNFSKIVIPLRDCKPYAELNIRLGDRKTYEEESSEVEKALGFLVENSKLQDISSLIVKYNGEVYMTQKGPSHVSHTADFVQFNDKAQRFFEPIVYNEKERAPSVEINGKPIQELGFKIGDISLTTTKHFKLPKIVELESTGVPSVVSFTQHYYSVSSFRPLQVYSLEYSRKGAIPICRKGEHIFLCFDFWLALEESKFTMKWDEKLPIYPVNEGFVSVVSPEWITHRKEEIEEDEFKLDDKTEEIGLEPIRGKNSCEVKTKAGKLEKMQKLFVQSRVAKPPWRIRFKFTTSLQPTGLLTYKFDGSCENCPLLKT